ncbi:Ig-like domain-containing protein [Clostridium botulinum]|uniref:Ig-like domain-containing protein n=1 Tax=Clostridium botulinum TaxID=1491 RepID=UPI0007738838|nr:Ig-like domain-containing protein [Clostridium botulinum]MBY6932214.1 Ig domain-containing protein [Clostridium botulinum]NFG21829.1 Ig domain-containing protein [Clostridium botulinum]NFO82306.1 Ig domain-containing protein [Clostridium botulinum]
MKNCFKKILVMFVMVLTIMGIGILQNGIIANAATVGEQLLQPEEGWKRYDDNDKNINYFDFETEKWRNSNMFKDAATINCNVGVNKGEVRFKFKGTSFRIISVSGPRRASNVDIYVDGEKESFSLNTTNNWQDLSYQKIGLEDSIHEIVINNFIPSYSGNTPFALDALDINQDGYLLDLNDISLTLDKSSLNLKENSSKKLTATTTPSAIDMDWSSSDETIATVDKSGKVTGFKEGTCIITAQIKRTDVKAICEVTVTKEDIVEPEEPSIENGSLYIEMIDGNIKRADKSQIEKFKKWFISRDLDETESPIFKITNAKGNAEYLVHDKVVGFEIRE